MNDKGSLNDIVKKIFDDYFSIHPKNPESSFNDIPKIIDKLKERNPDLTEKEVEFLKNYMKFYLLIYFLEK